MRPTALEKKRSSAKDALTKTHRVGPVAAYVVCVDNEGYEASLERNKIYLVLKDLEASSDGDLRIVDESGEDYLYSKKRFAAVELSASVKASVRKAALPA